MIDEDRTIQVIEFMLNTHGKQAFGIQRPRLTFGILIMNGNALGALDPLEDARHRKATLLALLLPLKILQTRIDERQQLVPLFRNIDDDNLLVDIHLSRRQTDTGRLVHGFGHVGNQASN